jgi:hypothetical protein
VRQRSRCVSYYELVLSNILVEHELHIKGIRSLKLSYVKYISSAFFLNSY